MIGLFDALLDRLIARPADLVAEDEGQRLTARELTALVKEEMAALKAAKVHPGEPVFLACSNRATDIAGFLAISSSGAVVVPVHRDATEATLMRLRAATCARITVNGRPDLPTLLPRKMVSVQGDPPKHRTMLEEAAAVVFTS
ncbi:MAG: AMP-binding protein, partial [Geminicoccaceae bacterium]